jgi:hypothetical protein
MDDWKPIFQGTSEAARSLAIHLDAAGVRSFVASHETHQEEWSTVLVAPDQIARASELVLQWSALQPQRVSELTLRLSRIVAVSALPSLFWLAAWWSKPG